MIAKMLRSSMAVATATLALSACQTQGGPVGQLMMPPGEGTTVALRSGVRASNRTPGNSQHLYVSVLAGPASVLRYRIVGDFPAQKPDRIYSGVGAPAAVQSNGTLYAEVNSGGGCFGFGPIDVFAPGAKSPTRTLMLPRTDGSTTAASRILISDDGYAFVAFYACYSGMHPKGSNKPTSALNSGIAVYAPNTSRHPFLKYSLPHQSVAVGLALGRKGALYASSYVNQSSGFVYTISNPRTKPVVRGTLEVNLYVLGVAVSGDPQYLYVSAGGPHGVPSQIQVFHPDASGHQSPSRVLNLPDYSGDSPAIFGSHVFIQGPNLTSIIAYPKQSSGSPPPVFTLDLPNSEPALDLSFGA